MNAKQYAVFRTDRDAAESIWLELQAGRLRQGWGWLDEQDLRLLRKKRLAGQELTRNEASAWRNRRMLGENWNALKVGDIVLVPNLPHPRRWIMARVSGAYAFDKGLAKGDGREYRHVLPVEPFRTKAGEIAVIHPNHPLVDARLRGTMRSMSRIWSIDRMAASVEALISAVEAGTDLSTGQTKEERREGFFDEARADVDEATWKLLQKRFRGAEFENLLVPLLENVYGEGSVDETGGPSEHGIDLRVRASGPMGLMFTVGVQVKLYDGILADLQPIDQLRRAHEHHKIHAGVVLTTAREVSEEFEAKARELSDELGMDVQIWKREDFVRLLMRFLAGG